MKLSKSQINEYCTEYRNIEYRNIIQLNIITIIDVPVRGSLQI